MTEKKKPFVKIVVDQCDNREAEDSTMEDLELLSKGIVYFDESSKDKTIKGRNIANFIKEFNSTDMKEMTLPKFKGKVKRGMFEKALEVYENNQNVYLDKALKKDKETIKKLRDLERWFCDIEEPLEDDGDEDEHEKREKQRRKGISSYCHSELKKLLE